VLVLPAGSFRSTPLWAGGAPVLVPAPRLLDARVLVAGDLVVGGAAEGDADAGDAAAGADAAWVSGEGDRARRATEAVLRGDDPSALVDLGVRWVLDERTSAGPRGEAARTLVGNPATPTTTRFAGAELVLHELGPPTGTTGPEDADARWEALAPPAAPASTRATVLAAHALWLLTLAVALTVAVAAAFASRAPRRSRR
jgi:hypothetical protein